MNGLRVYAVGASGSWNEVDAVWLGHDRYRCPLCRKGYFRVSPEKKCEPVRCESCNASFYAEMKWGSGLGPGIGP